MTISEQAMQELINAQLETTDELRRTREAMREHTERLVLELSSVEEEVRVLSAAIVELRTTIGLNQGVL